MTYTATIVKFETNEETGNALAEIDIYQDGANERLGNMIVSDTIANIHQRIKTDLAQYTAEHKANVEVEPFQKDFVIDDDGVVS
jgi:hypothetical protein